MDGYWPGQYRLSRVLIAARIREPVESRQNTGRVVEEKRINDVHGKPQNGIRFERTSGNRCRTGQLNPDKETDGKDDAAVRKMAMALILDLGRPFFLQAAEEVFGLSLSEGGEGPDGDSTPTERPVPTLQ